MKIVGEYGFFRSRINDFKNAIEGFYQHYKKTGMPLGEIEMLFTSELVEYMQSAFKVDFEESVGIVSSSAHLSKGELQLVNLHYERADIESISHYVMSELFSMVAAHFFLRKETEGEAA